MKIIDILNIIANGEEPPKKIIFRNNEYIYKELDKDYYCEKKQEYIFDDYIITDIINYPIEILETTITMKPEKIEYLNVEDYIYRTDKTNCLCIINDKINEIIDKLNGD